MTGRVGILAGSPGMTGAGQMASHAALRSGAGLITWLVPEAVYTIAATTAPTEVMVKPISSLQAVADSNFDVLVVGPGLGAQWPDLVQLIATDLRPMVIDADALNAVAASDEGLSALKNPVAPRVLTPHPGEMQRLLDASGIDKPPSDRAKLARLFTDEYPVTLLFKGARTIIAEQNKPLSYNTTGSPGMASGGMGDVLSGIIAALMAQGLEPYDAACTGSWLLGFSAESALREGQTEETLVATDVIKSLPDALMYLHFHYIYPLDKQDTHELA